MTEAFSVEQAGAVLTSALSAPGSGASVLQSFADVPSLTFTPAQPHGWLRRGAPARLDAGQWRFVAVEPGGTRMQVSHVVRGIALDSRLAGPAEAGPALAAAVLESARGYGPQAVAAAQAILYGIASVNRLS